MNFWLPEKFKGVGDMEVSDDDGFQPRGMKISRS